MAERSFPHSSRTLLYRTLFTGRNSANHTRGRSLAGNATALDHGAPLPFPDNDRGHRRRHKRSAARMSRIVSVVAADSWRLTCHEYEGRALLDMQRAREGVHPGRLVYDPVVADREVPAPCLTQPAYGYGGACWSRQTAVPPGLSGAPDGRRPAHRTAHGATGPPTDRRRRGRARCPVVRRRRGS